MGSKCELIEDDLGTDGEKCSDVPLTIIYSFGIVCVCVFGCVQCAPSCRFETLLN